MSEKQCQLALIGSSGPDINKYNAKLIDSSETEVPPAETPS